MATTEHFDWTLPNPGSDADTWGDVLNAAFGAVDLALHEVAVGAMPTGVVMDFLRTSAPAGWLELNGGTVGNAASGGTARQNADCQALFEVLWSIGALAIFSPGEGTAGARGASAAGDWAANKRIALPDQRGRFRRAVGGASGAIGELQGDAVGSHAHSFSVAAGYEFADAGNVNYFNGSRYYASGNYNGTTGNAGIGETRPVNIAYLTCIKF